MLPYQEIDALITDIEELVKSGDTGIVEVIRHLGDFKITMSEFSDGEMWGAAMLSIVRPLVETLKERRQGD